MFKSSQIAPRKSRILDTLLKKLGATATASTHAAVAPVGGSNRDPQRPMTVSASVNVDEAA
jgi:hypothetical protein